MKEATWKNSSEKIQKKISKEKVRELREKISSDNWKELILVEEAKQSQRIVEVAKDIISKKEIKVVCIAGPSSSGKTTFTNRLGIQLKANNLEPVIISLDNYYRGRDLIPIGEDGEKDFESIDGLDIPQLNQNLNDLKDGLEVEIPKYNFVTGVPEKEGTLVKLKENGIILIEGIHGLNEKLTSEVEKKIKYKVYISCLTELELDEEKTVTTTCIRKIRRIVRDSLSRATSAEETLGMWSSVARGERKNIFPHRGEADIIFNSTFLYELPMLRKLGVEELEKIDPMSPNYEDGMKLRDTLLYFDSLPTDYIPRNSILKEFLGGSIFYKY